MIIGIGFYAIDGINASAQSYPNQKFAIIDQSESFSLLNVASVGFKEHEGSFLVGAMASMVSKMQDIGFLGGTNSSMINRFLTGYRQGARYIDQNITINHVYSPNSTNPWGDLSGGKEVAESFIANGSDIIFAAAGDTGLGVFNAVEEANNLGGDKIYAIGVDVNQDWLKPGDILCSMIKHFDIAAETQIGHLVNGTWKSGLINLGIKENSLDISPMDNTTSERDAIWTGSMNRYEFVQDIKKAISNGSIVVDDTVNPDFVNPPETTIPTTPTTPTTTITPTTTPTSHETEESTGEDPSFFEENTELVIGGVAVIAILSLGVIYKWKMQKPGDYGIDRYMFKKILSSYDEIRISKFAELLEVEEQDLEVWLVDLASEFGFKMRHDVVIIDHEKIDDHIDELFKTFEDMEEEGEGKL